MKHSVLWMRKTLLVFPSLFGLLNVFNGHPIATRTVTPKDWRNYIGDDVYEYYNKKTSKRFSTGMFEGDIVGMDLEAMSRKNLTAFLAQNAIVEKDQLWPNGVIPYTLSSDFSSNESDVIVGALQDMMSKTCLKFVPRKSERSFITFIASQNGLLDSIKNSEIHTRKTQDGWAENCFYGSRCYSFVGRLRRQQMINLQKGCITYFGEVQHEVMHAIGFQHEQSRIDRDEYIQIIWDNIPEDRQDQFEKYRGETNGLPYDYNSIMHYGFKAFSVDDKSPTMIPYQKANIGNRKVMSPTDVKRINILYKCSETSASQTSAPIRSSRRTRRPITNSNPDQLINWILTDISNSGRTSNVTQDGDLDTGDMAKVPFRDPKSLCPSAAPQRLRNDNCQVDRDCLDSGLGRMCCRYCAGSTCINRCL